MSMSTKIEDLPNSPQSAQQPIQQPIQQPNISQQQFGQSTQQLSNSPVQIDVKKKVRFKNEDEVFEIDSFASLGVTKEKFQIQVYDFLAHGIFSDYNGLLGLDFLEGTKFCIDTRENVISLS